MLEHALLELFDRDERYNAVMPGLRREETAGVVRHVDLNGREGVVIHSRLSTETANSAIQAQVNYFGALGQSFEWKVFAYDEPSDLIERLRTFGFDVEETEAVMVLDMASFSAFAAETTAVERITTRAGLEAVAMVKAHASRVDVSDLVEQLAVELEQDSGYLSVYVVRVAEQPAAAAWIRFPANSAFASLWGGTTIPERRGRGLYTALLMARLREARARGYRYVTIDAGPMSRPIVEKRGFRTLTYATACIHHA